MLKKTLACILTSVMLLACAGETSSAAESVVTILGGSSGGLWAIIAEGVGEAMRRSFPRYRVTTEPGKDGPNQVLVGRGDVEFCLASDVLTLKALKGDAPFDVRNRKSEKLRLVAVVNPTAAVQIYMDARTGLTSLKELGERKYPLRINVNRSGTVNDLVSRRVMEAYGVSYEDIEAWGGVVHKGPAPEAVDLWDAGQMDAIVEASQFPLSRFYDLGMKHDLVMLPIDADKAEEINRDMGTFSMIIPAGTYSFQKEDCPTVSTRLLLVTSADQPDRIVTDMLTAMLENVEYLRSVHANLRGLSAESMAGYAGIPMHPAAERFFRRHAISKN